MGEAAAVLSGEAPKRTQLEHTMPKMKSNRAAAKRFKVTGSGRVRRGHCGHKHGMINKTRKHNRRLRKTGLVHKVMEKRIKLLLPYS